MNKREMEVHKAYLSGEKLVLTELRVVYEKALEDVKGELQRLQSMELTDSKIYQIEWQKAMEQQLEAIVNQLASKNYLTVLEYLSDTFDTGYWGTFYNLQGQGIPLIIPIAQDIVVNVLTRTAGNITLSSRLWNNANALAERVRGELSRGIAQGAHYNDIARNLANAVEGDLRNLQRIARTEGHRVYQESSQQAAKEAINAGADILKQWDSTFDSRTRPTHVAANGQIRNVDESFNVGDVTGMYPGGTGSAREDINCRCVSLQRARWALEGGEDTTKWDGEENDFVIFNDSDNFADFKISVS